MAKEVSLHTIVRKINGFCVIIFAVLFVLNVFIAFGIQDRPLTHGSFRILAAFILYLIAYLFSTFRYNRIAAFLSIFNVYLTIIVYPMLPFFKSKPAEDVFLLLFVFMIISVLVYLVYDLRNQKRSIIGWQFVLTLTFILSLAHTVEALDQSTYPALKLVFTQEPMLTIGYLGTLGLIHALFLRFKRENLLARTDFLTKNQRLNHALKLSKRQQEELETKHNELLRLQDQLKRTNDGLSEKIEKRKNDLILMNNIIEQYGFINVKMMNKPVSQLKESISTNDFMRRKELDKIVGDMKTLTTTISRFLNEKEPERMKKYEEELRKF